jgi:hypothetical protein
MLIKCIYEVCSLLDHMIYNFMFSKVLDMSLVDFGDFIQSFHYFGI